MDLRYFWLKHALCRRNSRSSYDIQGVSEDVWPQERRERLGRDQLDRMAKDALQEVAERDEMVKGLLSGCELEEKVDVASGGGWCRDGLSRRWRGD
jgi:hypothetical protein